MTTTTQPTVPLLDLKAQYATIRDEVNAAIAEVVESQYFVMGPMVEHLETEIARYVGCDHAIACASGSDAILLALWALDVGPGDEVICPGYTFFATAGSIARLGARPVFADIDPATYNICPEHVAKLAAGCRRLRAIMPVHLYGQSAEMDPLLTLGNRLGVPVVEDAAQAIGTKDKEGRMAGTIGTMGCFSFFPTKNLGAYGDGGIVTTDRSDLAERLAMLRNHGGRNKYLNEMVGMNSRLDALQAAVLRVKLRHLESWHAGRQANADHYDRLFRAAGAADSATPLTDAGLPLRTPHRLPEPSRHIFNQYVIRVPAAHRDPLREHCKERGVGTEIYYPLPLNRQECFADLGIGLGELPESEAAADQTIALPIYAELTDAQIDHAADTIVSYLTVSAAQTT